LSNFATFRAGGQTYRAVFPARPPVVGIAEPHAARPIHAALVDTRRAVQVMPSVLDVSIGAAVRKPGQ
jgi:hypothetical protein